MERNFELSINISEEVAEKLGINEDTFFDAYYEDGRLVIRAVDDEEYYDNEDDFDEDENEVIDCTGGDCLNCEYWCDVCGECIIDEEV